MAQWINVDAVTGKYQGWQRSSKGEIPASDDKVIRVEADDALLTLVDTLHREAADDGRADAVVYSDGQFGLAPDDRPRFRVETSALAEVGVEQAFTVTAIDAEGNAVTALNGEQRMRVNDRIFKLTFVDGVATRTFAFDKSGVFVIASSPDYAVESRVVIEVAE